MTVNIKPRAAQRWGYVSRTHSHTRHDAAWPFGDNHKHECGSFGKDFGVSFGSVLKKAAHDCPSIAMDYNVLSGSPRIAGTRIPVYMVLDAVQYHGNVEGARVSYPELTIEQVKDALSFAGAVLEQPIEHEP
jgi:uncharacterized protein (DUF433 family)